MIVTRFAPSPTGHLHLGHAYAALFAFEAAQKAGGQFLLRIEDIDPVRCKPGMIEAIFEDLRWLGLAWPEPVRCQSQHMDDYAAALATLQAQDLIYRCFCTRSEIAAALSAPHEGEPGQLYPGTCRHLPHDVVAQRVEQGDGFSWRLNGEKAVAQTGELVWHDRAQGVIAATPQLFGDVVLARKDIPVSYHLCVTVDDHLQGINLMTRGKDLFASTHIHRLLQALLGFVTPDYHHHDLLTDENGKRLAKRDQSITLRALRESGKTAADVRKMVIVN